MKSIEQINTENSRYLIFAAQPHPTETVMYFLVDNNIPFQVLLGSYKGVLEVSYCVPLQYIIEVEQAGFLTEQESVLIVGTVDETGHRTAFIQYTGKEDPEYLGHFKPTAMADALRQDGWSYNPVAQSFFTIQE